MSLIEFKNVTVGFNDQIIIKDFNLKINNGEKVLVTGSSGSGKSTLFKLLLGFAKPLKGDILIDNIDISAHNIWELRKQFSYVSQDLDIGSGSVKECFQSILNLKVNKQLGITENDIDKKLEFFNLNNSFLRKNMQELSGGEKQRVAITMTTLLDRKILLLDEITSALDNKNKQIVIEYFLKNSKTAMIITHDKSWNPDNNLQSINMNEHGSN